ncbi:HTTM domain-containing protein [Streptomyces chryseus]|uniref:HTTM domain-containing protein n=1 Tax=Streptomyces chryseus TaxID=68186 RepID=A0ABQ3DNJ6_9ACTN|nr:HTTM domain-containing protein [Streptomyces chryseus]GGX15411.1 HTTM domain-containing protein [Streptomyces chryseus]GHB09286.1 HTTM domain-containing protein [Streptomyces chryseus]
MTVRAALALGRDAAGGPLRQVAATARKLTLQPLAPYSAAAIRIGLGGLYLIHLLRESVRADRLWGPGSPFTADLFAQTLEARGWDGPFSWWYSLLVTDSALVFWAWYGLAVVLSALLMLGWRTRAVSVLFWFLVVAFYIRGSMANSGWALLSLLFANYLVFVASGRHWSLDARRRARRAQREKAAAGSRFVFWGEETEELRRRLVTVLHNGGMAMIALQVMVIYGSAAMYKIQGESWRNGTALYYSMMYDDFSTFPELSAWIASHGTFAALMAYVTVFSQMLFPALVFNRRLKYCILVVMLTTHIGIGLLMALPMFSAITIVGDLVFLPTTFWLAASRLVRTVRAAPEEEKPRAPVPPAREAADAGVGSSA